MRTSLVFLAIYLTFIPCIESFTPTANLARSSVTRTRLNVGQKETIPDSIAFDSLTQLDSCTSRSRAQKILESALPSESRLYGSVKIPPGASAKGLSDGDLAIQTRTIGKRYKIMDLIETSGNKDADRASLGLLCVMVASSVSAISINQNLPGPEIIRFIVVWILTFAPLFYVGYGIATPSELQALLVSVQRIAFPGYRKRMLQHEAGHLLMGHLLGWPIAGYRANAVKNAVEFFPLSDRAVGDDLASQLGFDKRRYVANTETQYEQPDDVPFFSKEGRGALLLEERSVFRAQKNYTDNPFLKLSKDNQPRNAWPYRGFDERSLDQLASISVAGVCAEILAFGNAEGGIADLSQLRQIFASSETEMDEREIENRIKYALGFTMGVLRTRLGALDALAAAMDEGKCVSECIQAIETCPNVSGNNGMGSNYEIERRKRFFDEELSLIERVLLGGDRRIDASEDRFVEGKGGGYREKRSFLPGDDPLYAALAVTIGFLLWASAGGLSLH